MDGEPLPATAAVVLAGATGLPPPTTQYPEPDSDDDSEDDADDALLPPGPVDPDRCTISGPGYSGGAAQSAVSFFVTAKDAAGKRIREGGADFQVRVEPRSNALANGATVAELTTRDNGDGTYTASYAVTARGDYELSVDMNGKPIGGSPFPVFFSPPEVAAPPEAQAADLTAGALTSTGLPNSLAETAQQIALRLQPDLAKLTTASIKAANMLPAASSMGGSAHIGGVVFPTDEVLLDRSLLVGNITSVVNTDQLRQLFGFCGTVRDCRFVGIARTYAFVEFDNEEEATSALSMNNLNVMGSLIKVELAISAYRASPQGAPDPIQQLQAHQLAQLQLVQMQQESLAAQVAQMRAAAKTLPNAAPPVVAQNSQSQKAAALAAAAALSKRLGLAAGGGRRSPSPPRGRRRRSASPRERRFRLGRTDNRAREAERAAQRETEERARQEAARKERSSRRSRSRSAARDVKSRDRDRRSRERRDRDRHRHRDDRRADEERHRSHGRDSERKDRDRDRDGARDGDRDRDRVRDRNRDGDRDRARAGRDRDADKGRRRDDSRERRRQRDGDSPVPRGGEERRGVERDGGDDGSRPEPQEGSPLLEATATEQPIENGQEAIEQPITAAVANGVDAGEDCKRGRDSELAEGDAVDPKEERPRKRKHHKKDKDKHRRRDKEKHSRRERRSHSVQDDEPHEGASKDDEAEELRALALQRLAGSGAEGGGNDE